MKRYLLPIFLCVFITAVAQRNRPSIDETAGNYYQKQAYASGIHILASDKAPDSCLVRTGEQLNYLMSRVSQDVLDAMDDERWTVVAMGRYEGITQLPEFKNYPGIEPWWDIHKRGWGATSELPFMLCAEENVLAYQIDPNYAEDILVNSFAKSLFECGIKKLNHSAEQRLAALLSRAKAAGKWQNTIAGQSALDYWAEGVQDWFNVNAEAPLPNGEHNWVNTAEDLQRYDPALFEFIGQNSTKRRNSISMCLNAGLKQYQPNWQTDCISTPLSIKNMSMRTASISCRQMPYPTSVSSRLIKPSTA